MKDNLSGVRMAHPASDCSLRVVFHGAVDIDTAGRAGSYQTHFGLQIHSAEIWKGTTPLASSMGTTLRR